MKDVIIYTDGACKKSKVGAWASILIFGEHEKEISGRVENTTNNKMELRAVIEGLRALKFKCNVTVYSDSQYVVNGSTSWVDKWIKNNWKTASGSPVKNQSEWESIVALKKEHNVSFKWVKGHSDNEYNNRCDRLAVTLTKD